MVVIPSNTTILCVDDEASGLYFRKLILEQHGYRVLTAVSASEGLDIFKASDVDLVVTDHLLGRGTGTKMAAEIRSLKPEVPIIVLSGTSDVPEGLEHADIFLSKTEGPEKLLVEIQALLACRQPAAKPSGSLPKLLPFDPENGTFQALLAAIVEGSDDAIFSKTLEGIVTSWNRAAERMYGYSSEEIVGKPLSILLPPDRPNEVRDILTRLKRGERLKHYETTRVAKDGHPLNVSLTISPIQDAQGKIVGASTIARDITRLKMAEQALRNSERLAVAGRMAATVAHEINNPIESVSNILYLLGNSKALDETSREFVRAAQEELKRISQITKVTLGFYRNWERRQVPVKIIDLVENVLTLYSRKSASLGISIEKQYRSEGIVTGDAGELRQVFSNLILNAMEALTKAGSRLRIRIFDSADWKDRNLRGVRTIISDNGPGIPLADRARIFDPFYTTKGEEGTGVGLWVSRGIVENHAGSICFKTRVTPQHSGTAFSVFLPLVSGVDNAS
jgi:two-component system, chemotaxis family, CheB/CheR fusion protein